MADDLTGSRPKRAPPIDPAMDAESFFHVALKVDDLDESLAFYREQLGGELIERGRRDEFEDTYEYAALSLGDKRLYLFDRAPYEAAGHVDTLPTGVLHFGYVVDDVAEASRSLAASDVRFVMEPMTFGDLKVTFFADPDGTRIELLERLD